MKLQSFFERKRVGMLLLWGGLALCLAACSKGGDVQPTQTPVSDYTGFAAQTAPGSVTANGVLVAARQVAVSFEVAGTVESVAVVVGDNVRVGQTIATLDTVELQRAVARAELELETAQARLIRLQVQATPVPERVLAATAAISSAQAALVQAHVQAGQRANQDIIDQAALEQAERALQDAKNEYQKVVDNPTKRDWAHASPQADVLADMQDHYDVVMAEYRMRVADRGYAAAIAAAEARLAQAQLALYEAQHLVAPEELALAQLDLVRARQTLDVARADLAQATLQAPFDGVVSAVPVNVGEWAAPGLTVIELLDVSRWRVETKNVGELEIGRVQVGQDVLVRVNAFRDETLPGRVVTISPVAVVQQGDTTYTLMIEVETTDLNLRPGMTAQVEILTE